MIFPRVTDLIFIYVFFFKCRKLFMKLNVFYDLETNLTFKDFLHDFETDLNFNDFSRVMETLEECAV